MKGCIFDLDGTLTDTLDSMYVAINLTLKEMNLPEITREQCREYIGNGMAYLVEHALMAVGDEKAERKEEGISIYSRIFDQYCTYHVVPYEGIMDLLETLKSKGYKMAVLSNKPHQQAVTVVKEIFGENLFDWVQGQTPQVPRKPKPDGIYVILNDWGMEKEDCLYVGDSEVDMQTGTYAGVKTVGVTWGFRKKEVLLEAGGKNLIDKPADLLYYA